MSIEVIPAGSSAVVTAEKYSDNSAVVVGAIKDAEADLERSTGLHYGDTLGAIKDVEADLERSNGLHYGDTVKTIKDVEADLERSGGLHYGDTVKTVKDTEAQLERSFGSKYGHLTDNVKDNKFAIEHANAKSIDTIRQAEIATEKAKAKIVELVQDVKFEAEKAESRTREYVDARFSNLKDTMQDVRRELELVSLEGFKENMIEHKMQETLSWRLHAEAEKTACNNQMQNLLQFKDQALLSEKLAYQASKERFEQFASMRDLVRAENQITRDLLNRQEQEHLHDRTIKAEQQLANFALLEDVRKSFISSR